MGTEIGENRIDIEEKADWNWFLHMPVSYIGQRKLITCFKTPERVRAASEKQIEQLIGKNQPVKEYLESSRNKDWRKAYIEMEEKGIRLTLKKEESYPCALAPLADAPYGLYHIGELPKEELCVSIVGARSCSRYGQEIASALGRCLAEEGIYVISGMARGIDGASQRAALEHGGKSAAVLGSGVDVCYPEENRGLYDRLLERGCIISEFPPGAKPLAWHFPVRNRIISGLSKVLVVVEARERSGSLITADLALEQGKDIYAVPGRMTDSLSRGCNRLIKNGAGILLSPRMLLEELGIFNIKKQQNSKKSTNRLAENENLVYSGLDLTPKSTEAICRETGLSLAETTELLVSLQLKGLILEAGIGHYALFGGETDCRR